MSRGYPDYHNNAGQVSVSVIDTTDDFASKFGISRLDNRGHLLFADNWKEGFTGYLYTLPANPADVGITTLNSLLDTGSLFLAPVLGAGTQNFIMAKRVYLIAPFRTGVEFAFRQTLTSGDVRVVMNYISGGIYLQGWIDYIASTHSFRIRLTTGFETVYVIDEPVFDTYYVRVKLVVDFLTGQYVRLLVGNQQIDLRAYTLYTSTGAGKGAFDTRIYLFADKTIPQVTQFGYIITTIDEP